VSSSRTLTAGRKRLLRACYWSVWMVFQFVPVAVGLMTRSWAGAILVCLLVNLGFFLGLMVTLQTTAPDLELARYRVVASCFVAAFVVGVVALLMQRAPAGLVVGVFSVLGSAIGLGAFAEALYGHSASES
jgi:hypothetical protein